MISQDSLLGTGVVNQRILPISHRECTRGGQKLPPLVHSLWESCPHSLWEMDGIQWCVTREHNKLLYLRYHLSTSYSTFWEKISSNNVD